jgi:hypothetical protein
VEVIKDLSLNIGDKRLVLEFLLLSEKPDLKAWVNRSAILYRGNRERLLKGEDSLEAFPNVSISPGIAQPFDSDCGSGFCGRDFSQAHAHSPEIPSCNEVIPIHNELVRDGRSFWIRRQDKSAAQALTGKSADTLPASSLPPVDRRFWFFYF